MDTGFVTGDDSVPNVSTGVTTFSHPGFFYPQDPWGFLSFPILVVAGIGYTIIAVGLVLEKEGTMDRSDRIAQLYGYSVCLVAIVVALTSIGSLVNDAFQYANPLRAQSYAYGGFRDLSSFEAFKATYDLPAFGERTPPPKLSDAELHERYEVLRSEHIAQVRYGAVQSMTGSAVLLVLAILLFAFHWRWLKNRAKQA